MSVSGQSAEIRDGRATFLWVPTGRYNLTYDSDDMPIEVSHDLDVNFAPMVYDCLLVEITDANGALAQRGLRSGDKLIAIADQTLNPDTLMWGSMLLAAAGQRRVTVLRGGQQIALEFTVEEAIRDLGGTLTPARR